MPIALLCGSCNAKLNAPDAAAGKKVKCPKCATILQIPLPEPEPSFEVVDDEPAPPPKAKPSAPAKPKPKPVLLDEDDEDDAPPPPKKPAKKPAVVLDDEDEDEEELPRPKKGKGKSKKAAGGKKPLILGVAVGVVAVVGVLFWYFVLREPQITSNTPAPPPENSMAQPSRSGGPGGAPQWVEYKNADFTVRFRNQVGQVREKAVESRGIRAGTSYGTDTQNPRGGQIVTVFNLSDNLAPIVNANPNDFLESMLEQGGGKGTISARTDATLDGKPARAATVQVEQRTMFLRAAIDGKRAFLLLAGGDGVTDADHDQVKTFFDSFKMAAGAPNPVPNLTPNANPPAGWRTSGHPEFLVWQRIENGKPFNQYFKEGLGPIAAGTRIVSNEDLQGRRNQVVWALPLDKATQSAPLAEVVDGLAEAQLGRGKKENILSRSEATLDGRPARQLVIRQGEEMAVARGVVANNRLFLVASTGPGLTEQDADVKTFFDGFKIGADVPLPPPAAGPTAPLEPTDLSKYGVPVVVNLPKGTKVETILDDDDRKALTLELDRNITVYVNLPSSMKNWRELSDQLWKGWKTVKDEPNAHMWENPIGAGAAKVVAHGVFRLVTTPKGDVGFRMHSGGVNRAQADYVWDCLKTAKAK